MAMFCFHSLAIIILSFEFCLFLYASSATSSSLLHMPQQQQEDEDEDGQLCSLGSFMFVFGDSQSDTGNLVLTGNSALQGASSLPYGMTYFKHGTGRFSNGRLMVDCLRQTLGLPFLPPYLRLGNADFTNGVNYAVASSTALSYPFFTQLGVRSYTDRDLDTQLLWHQNFLNHIQSPLVSNETSVLPSYSDIQNATYFLFSGGNDIGNLFMSGMSQVEVNNLLPTVVEKISNTIQLLYGKGARNFVISNIAQMGCLPVIKYFLSNAEQDASGCVRSVNEACYNYSEFLENLVDNLRTMLPNSNIIFLDFYSAIEEIMSQPAKFGLKDISNTCCGPTSLPTSTLVNNYNPLSFCGHLSTLRDDPNGYLIWDGIHFTDTVYRQMVNMFAQGKFISPKNALTRCNPTLLERA